MRVLAILLLGALGAYAQPATGVASTNQPEIIQLTPETLLIAQIKSRMRDNLGRQPDYTCVETIERTRQPVGGGAQLEDTLRLEVALIDQKELFGWPGSTEFEDKELRDLITTGTFGNGNFAIFAEMLFYGGGPAFEPQGRTEVRDIEVERFDYRVPRALSNYYLSLDDREGVAGFHGSIYVDPETLDLVRMEVIGDDIPSDLGITGTEERIDYGRVEIGGGDFLLPVQSRLTIGTPEVVNRNLVRFSSCRKFTGESSLVFVDPEFEEASEAPVVEEAELPPETQIELVIRTRIELAKGAIGDAVEADLNRDIKVDGEVLVPKGAKARGRIIRLDRHPRYFILGIRFTDLDWEGGHARLTAVFDRVALGLRSLSDNRPPAIDTRQLEGYMVIFRPGLRIIDDLLTYWRTL